MSNNDLSRILHYHTLIRQYLDAQLKRLAGNLQIAFEPYQRTASESGTIRPEDFFLYAAESGSRETRIALWIARASVPELAKYIPEYSVAKESMPLAESNRDQSGFVQQTIPQTSPARVFEKRPYREEQYSYRRYFPKDYLKLTSKAIKAVYGKIEKKVVDIFEKFKRIRSIYQSASGVMLNRKQYDGGNVAPKNNVVSLDVYRQATERRKYTPPQTANLEEILAIA